MSKERHAKDAAGWEGLWKEIPARPPLPLLCSLSPHISQRPCQSCFCAALSLAWSSHFPFHLLNPAFLQSPIHWPTCLTTQHHRGLPGLPQHVSGMLFTCVCCSLCWLIVLDLGPVPSPDVSSGTEPCA